MSSKSGLTKEERYSFLRENGWEQAREGKGSHSMWVHHGLKELGQKFKIDMPPNLAATDNQHPWDMLLCVNPAAGTWANVEKQVKWCARKIAEIKTAADNKLKYRSIKAEFNNAVRGVKQWKRETIQRLRVGLSPNEAPSAYHNMNDIVKAKNDMKKGGL